jgi:hypothetical protein
MNPAKKGVVLKPTFATAVTQGVDPTGSYTFDSYLSTAGEQLKSSNQRIPRSTPITRVGTGLPSEVVDSITRTLGWRDAQHKLSVGWGFLPEGQLFDVDYETREIRLNSRHRVFLSATEENTHEDAPVVRTLLFLLVESYFKGGHLKQQTRDQIRSFQEILAVATELQLKEIIQSEEGMSPSRSETEASENPAGRPAPHSEPIPLQVFGDKPRGEQTNSETTRDSSNLAAIDHGRSSFPQRVQKPRAPISPSNEEIPENLSAHIALAIATHYRKGRTIGELAAEHQISERTVAYSLAETAFGPAALDDDSAAAFRDGAPWDPHEREKIESLFKKGATVSRISSQIGRTPFAIAWKLLDRPEGVEIPNSKLLALRHRWSSGG